VLIGVIPPGRGRVYFDGGWGGTYPRLGIEVAFTDRAGVHWVRRARGLLDELPLGAFDHFKLPRPRDLVTAEPDELSKRSVHHHARVRALSATARPKLVGALFPRLDRYGPHATPRRATSSPATANAVTVQHGARAVGPTVLPPRVPPIRSTGPTTFGKLSVYGLFGTKAGPL
jgi:hypothetical protein